MKSNLNKKPVIFIGAVVAVLIIGAVIITNLTPSGGGTSGKRNKELESLGFKYVDLETLRTKGASVALKGINDSDPIYVHGISYAIYYQENRFQFVSPNSKIAGFEIDDDAGVAECRFTNFTRSGAENLYLMGYAWAYGYYSKPYSEMDPHYPNTVAMYGCEFIYDENP